MPRMALPSYPAEKRREIAQRVGIDEQYLYQISRGLKTAKPALAKQLNLVDPAALLWDLRPDDWHLIWPDLVGQDGGPTLKAEQGA